MNIQNLADFLSATPQKEIFLAIVEKNLEGKKLASKPDNEVFLKVIAEKGYLIEGFLSEKGLEQAKLLFAKPEIITELKLKPDFLEKLKKFELPKNEKPKTEPKPEGTPAPAQTDNKEILELPKSDFDKILAQIQDLQTQVQKLHSEQSKVKEMTIFDVQEKLKQYYAFQEELEALETAKRELDLFIKRLNSPVNEDELKITFHCGSSQKTIRVFGSVQKCANLINDIAIEHIEKAKKEMQALTSII